jgi:hypothetical protein
MTPDELPADMEALIERVALPWVEAEEMSVDPEELAKAGQALRDLLKAYQEQRRALERSQSLLRECLGDYGHRNFTDRYGMADRIRAALNQKGDQR